MKKITSLLALLILTAVTVVAAPKPEPWPPNPHPINPHSAKLDIKSGPPGFVILDIKVPKYAWYEIQVTEDFATWRTILMAWGTGHHEDFIWPTTPVYIPVMGTPIGESGHLFFRLCLHDEYEPWPPL